MKLKNKKTGEIVDYISFEKGGGQISMYVFDTNKHYYYNSLAELNEEWEDYEEPKVFWYIEGEGDIHHIRTELCNELEIHTMKRIGNYFKTKEEAKKVVEKLKAITRLKNKGFRFSGFSYTKLCDYAKINIKATMINDSINDDLELLFGGEE